MVTAEEGTSTGISGMLGEVQRIYENGSVAVPPTLVEVIRPAREGKKRSAKMQNCVSKVLI